MFIKEKRKQVNKIDREAAYLEQKIQFLLVKLQRTKSLPKLLDCAVKITSITIKMKMLFVNREIIRQQPKPRFPSGGCSDIATNYVRECGPEFVSGHNRRIVVQFGDNRKLKNPGLLNQD